MLRTRVIPVLLLKSRGLVKTIKFQSPKYVGDPINAVKIFNEKEVDEIVIFDIEASKNGTGVQFDLIEDIAKEAFMPLAYGGGITKIKEIKRLFKIGIEKVALNSCLSNNISLVKEASQIFGSQSIIVSIDVKKNFWGSYDIYHKGGTIKSKYKLMEYINQLVNEGAGELFINSIDKDGTQTGYDLALLKKITSQVNIPVVACGGAGKVSDLSDAVNQAKVSGVAAGSMFVFYGKHRAVLITYPNYTELDSLFS